MGDTFSIRRRQCSQPGENDRRIQQPRRRARVSGNWLLASHEQDERGRLVEAEAPGGFLVSKSAPN
jgi:hypothetical protein